MATKKKKKKATSAKKSNDINVQIQQLASDTAKEVQKMVNSANKEALNFNAQEAKKVRDYNSLEASTARDFNASQTALERDFNSAEAQKARDWQSEMSNTAHQREVADLRKAGLNPVLSANTGAQSYTTSSASAGSASAQNASASNASGSVESGANVIASLMSSLMGSMSNIANTKASAQASLDAARISGAYNLRAAETSASAQRYSADMAYKTQMEKPQSNVVALADKYFGSKVGSSFNSLVGNIPKSAYGFYNNGKPFVAQGSLGSYDKSLRIIGIEPSKLSEHARVKCCEQVLIVKFGSKSEKKSALSYLKKVANNNSDKAKTVASSSPFKGNDWNPYSND